MTKFWPLAIVALFSALAGAQTQPILQPHAAFVDLSGSPCAGCLLYSYMAGTTTPQPTFTDLSGVTQNPNPVVLDAAGGAAIWIGSTSYKFVLTDANGGTIWTVDQVRGYLGQFLQLTGGTVAGIITATQFIGPLTGAVTGNINGSVYCPLTSTFSACLASLSPGGTLIMSPGIYAAGTFAPFACMSKANVTVIGAGTPQYNAGNTALVGGTIIQGFVGICASNFAISNLGIDVGSDFINGGAATDGLVMEGQNNPNPADPLLVGAKISNVVALGTSAGAPFHGILIEHYTGVTINNVESRLQQHCFAFKSSNLTANGIKYSGCSTDGIAVKGDAYTQLSNVNISGVQGHNIATGDTNGIQVVATESTGTVTGVSISDFTGVGMIAAVTLQNNSGVGAGALSNVTLSNLNQTLLNTGGTSPTCILTAGPTVISNVQVNGLLCYVNDLAQAVAPLSMDATFTGTLSNLTFINSGFASDVEGTVTINGINDIGPGTGQSTIFAQVSSGTVLQIYGWYSNRGNLPFTTSVGATGKVFPGTQAMTSDGTNITLAGNLTGKKMTMSDPTTSDTISLFQNSGAHASYVQAQGGNNFAGFESITPVADWLTGSSGGDTNYEIQDNTTNTHPKIVKIAQGAPDSSFTIQPTGQPTFGFLSSSGCLQTTAGVISSTGVACAGAAGAGVASIDAQTGAFTFAGGGVSHVGNAYTFTGAGAFSALTASTNTTAAMLVGTGASLGPTGSGTVTANAFSGNLPVANLNSGTGAAATTWWAGDGTWKAPVRSFTASAGSWPTWLVPTVTNSTTTPTLAVAASAIPNAALANPSTTVNGQTCTLGSSCIVNSPVTVTTSASISMTGSSGLYYNGDATAGAAITYTLPTPVAGYQFCATNLISGSTADTGQLKILVANTGTQSIVYNGAKSTAAGNIQSSGAAGDSACVIGLSSTQWVAHVGTGSWTLN